MAEGKLTQGEAYQAAGYSCSSPANASAAATRLLKNVKVQARIHYLQEQAANLAVLDKSYVLMGLKRNAQAAYEKGDISASNRALELLGKDLGMFRDRVDVELSARPPQVDDERRRALIMGLLGTNELAATD